MFSQRDATTCSSSDLPFFFDDAAARYSRRAEHTLSASAACAYAAITSCLHAADFSLPLMLRWRAADAATRFYCFCLMPRYAERLCYAPYYRILRHATPCHYAIHAAAADISLTQASPRS